MERSISEAYIRRCHKRLIELGAPLEDWFCENVYDEEEASFTCELCDCDKVRYVHVMRNLNYLGAISVGCICAGVMEGDILAAQEREREARNRAQRRKNFVSKGWTPLANGVHVRSYHGTVCKIMVSKYNKQQYGVLYQGRWCWNYHQNPMTSFAQAATAAFYAYEKEQADARKTHRAKTGTGRPPDGRHRAQVCLPRMGRRARPPRPSSGWTPGVRGSESTWEDPAPAAGKAERAAGGARVSGLRDRPTGADRRCPG